MYHLDIHIAQSQADYAANRNVRIIQDYKSLKEFEVANNEMPFYARLAYAGNHIVAIKREGWNHSVAGRFDVKRMRTRNYLKLYPSKGYYSHIKASDVRI
jgi:hypothetical protein